jgi:hypothetical protein
MDFVAHALFQEAPFLKGLPDYQLLLHIAGTYSAGTLVSGLMSSYQIRIRTVEA